MGKFIFEMLKYLLILTQEKPPKAAILKHASSILRKIWVIAVLVVFL